MGMVGSFCGSNNHGSFSDLKTIGEGMKRKDRFKIKITETDIKHQVKEYLDLMRWFSFPLVAGLGSYPGLPDRIAIKGGRILFLEIKRPSGRLSEEQKLFQANMGNVRGEYYVVRSLEDLIEAIRKGGEKHYE